MKRMWSKNEIKNMPKDITTLVDSQEHERFIEGSITLQTENEGITLVYGKWSLSGTHLMFVIALDIADTTKVAQNTKFIANDLPQWVLSKIYPIFNNVVENKSATLYGDNWSTQTLSIVEAKEIADGKNYRVVFLTGSAITLTKDRSGRIQFDLLIDND